jgi:hypothetical protein
MSRAAKAAEEKAARMAMRRRPAPEIVEESPAEPVEAPRTPRPSAERSAGLRTKPVRVSLDLSPQLYRDLGDWSRDAAESLGRGRVTHADTLRALVRELLSNPALSAKVIRAIDTDS